MAHHWTPLEMLERTPGSRDEWIMFDGAKKIAVIREVKLGLPAEKLIRAVTYAERSEDRVLLGYFPHLRIAAWVVFHEWTKAKSSPSQHP